VRTGSEFDPSTRMLPLFARVEDPMRRQPGAEGTPLPMGLFVDAEIGGIHLQNVFILPRSAVRDEDQVLVVDEDGRLRIRGVEIVRAERERVLVQSGLSPDDLVCVSQIETVVDGMQVRTSLENPAVSTDAGEEAEL